MSHFTKNRARDKLFHAYRQVDVLKITGTCFPVSVKLTCKDVCNKGNPMGVTTFESWTNAPSHY